MSENKSLLSYDNIVAAIVIAIVIAFSCIVAHTILNEDPKARGELNGYHNKNFASIIPPEGALVAFN